MHLLTPKYRRHWSQRQMKTRRRRVEIGAMTYEKPKLRSLHLTKSHIQGNEKVLQTINIDANTRYHPFSWYWTWSLSFSWSLDWSCFAQLDTRWSHKKTKQRIDNNETKHKTYKRIIEQTIYKMKFSTISLPMFLIVTAAASKFLSSLQTMHL